VVDRVRVKRYGQRHRLDEVLVDAELDDEVRAHALRLIRDT